MCHGAPLLEKIRGKASLLSQRSLPIEHILRMYVYHHLPSLKATSTIGTFMCSSAPMPTCSVAPLIDSAAVCSVAPLIDSAAVVLVDEENILSSKLDAFVSGRFEPN